jgi:hypothetical protein
LAVAGLLERAPLRREKGQSGNRCVVGLDEFGHRTRYFVCTGTLHLGSVLLAGAAKAIEVRDRWIRGNERARLRNLPRIVA